MGDFDITRRRIGHVDLTLGFSRDNGTPTPEMHWRTVDVISRSLAFFEEMFGPYPLDELTVVVLPRAYSQSFLGFITLTDSVADAGGCARSLRCGKVDSRGHDLSRGRPPVVGQPDRLVELSRPVAQRGDGQLRGPAVLLALE